MVNCEQPQSQRMIGLPFTAYCLPHALRSALSALPQGGIPKTSPLGPDSLLFISTTGYEFGSFFEGGVV